MYPEPSTVLHYCQAAYYYIIIGKQQSGSQSTDAAHTPSLARLCMVQLV